MDKEYWPEFWKKHGKASVNENQHLQVLRTQNKMPIEEECWQRTLDFVLEQIDPQATDDILDLCCGNGLISSEISKKCRSVQSVDIAPELVEKIDIGEHPNITPIVGDIRTVELPLNSFDKVVIYAAIQYLTLGETVAWFEKMIRIIRDGGILYIGDIPDRARLWSFFNSPERESIHFECVKNEEAIVGTWFEQDWLCKLACHAGFKHAEIVPQPDYMIYTGYRYDMKVFK